MRGPVRAGCLVALSKSQIRTAAQSEGKKEVCRRIETRLHSQKHEARSISTES